MPVHIPHSEIGELVLQTKSVGIFATGEYPAFFSCECPFFLSFGAVGFGFKLGPVRFGAKGCRCTYAAQSASSLLVSGKRAYLHALREYSDFFSRVESLFFFGAVGLGFEPRPFALCFFTKNIDKIPTIWYNIDNTYIVGGLANEHNS